MKRTILLASFVFLFFYSKAQWNPNTSKNLAVAKVNSSDIIIKQTTTGKTFVAFYNPTDSNYNMRAQLLDSNGVKLFGDSGVLVSSRKSGSSTSVFDAAVDDSSNFIIAFTFQKPGDTSYIVVYKIDSLGNSQWGIQNDGIVLGAGIGPNVASFRNGNAVVAWSTLSDSSIVFQKIGTIGNVQFDAPDTLADTNPVTAPQIAVNADKSFSIIYQKEITSFISTNLYALKYDQNGQALWGTPLQISNIVTAGYASYAILANVDTTYVGYYGNPSNSNVFEGYVQRINPDETLPWGANGTEFANYSKPSDPNTFYLSLAHGNGSSNVWAVATITDPSQVNSGISIQSFDASSGSRLLSDSAKTIFPVSSSMYQQQGKLLLCNGNPIFMFTNVTNTLYATELDSSSVSFAWSPYKVLLGSTTNAKGRFNFTKRPLGDDAIAVWQEDRGSGDMPYAQNITCDGSTGALPVSLLNFHGIYTGGVTNLYWQTSQEINNTGFEVQRSFDDNNFAKISFINTQANGGNSTAALNYSYTDLKVPGENVYYRLKQIDKNGLFTYSNTLLIKSLNNAGITIYPNPVTSCLNMNFASVVDTKITLVVTDMLGRVLAKQTQSVFNGDNTFKINCATLKSGMYLLKSIDSNSSATFVQKFIKQ